MGYKYCKSSKSKEYPITMKTSLIDIVGIENFIQEIPKEFEKIWENK